MATPAAARHPTVKSVARALELLAALAEGEELALGDLAGRAALVPSTAHRLLLTLIDAGYVVQNPQTRRYGVGTRLLEYSVAVVRRLDDLRAAAAPVMAALAAEVGETVHLTVLDRRDVLFVAQELGPGRVRMDVDPGTRVSAHVTAAGKSVLAWQAPDSLDALLADWPLERFTEHTITDADDFRRELEKVRRRGWALDYQEQEEGVACVGAPILADDALPTAALSVSGPTSRLRRGSLPALAARVEQAAREVAERLQPA
jgi:IclR family acetate operon transcriptional repressor